ncbi:steroidogenic acute regulatory protein-like isoform X2 [Prorops nasuta]|uniref:steroidogenic acute regulatory protein-like isoform X2 n=1 Tax=Prorops nasuta TaxID=863751 RepID=UPI0034CFCABE
MAEDERQIREIAEVLISGSINSQRSSCTHQSVARTPDVILSEAVTSGERRNGRMSDVRRFFCLFVTFDLVFTCLLWLICTMIDGESLPAAFVNQVVHYHVKTSFFDIVMAAICRFTVLLLFYALVYMNHWIIVATSTTLTSAFLIAKVSLFNWSAFSQPVFQVLLIISSFILAWSEVWFFDFRVIPQENQARNWMQSRNNDETEPLLQNVTADRRYNRTFDPVSRFFTPVDSPNRSETEDDNESVEDALKKLTKPIEPFIKGPLPPLSQEKIEEHTKKASTLLRTCYELLISKDWQVEGRTAEGDTISYMHLPKQKIMKISGVIDAPAATVIDFLFENIEDSGSWNKTVTESIRLQKIDENTDIIYQATGAFGGGIVGARDFVILRRRGKYENYYMSSGVSVNLASVPSRKHVVRGENGVGCWAAEDVMDGDNRKCVFTWVLNTNLKGWIPQRMVDMTMATGLAEYLACLRKHLREIKH